MKFIYMHAQPPEFIEYVPPEKERKKERKKEFDGNTMGVSSRSVTTALMMIRV